MLQSNRGFAFALFYAVMNIAALSVGVVLDFFRITIKRGLGIASLPETSVLNSGMRLFILTGEPQHGPCAIRPANRCCSSLHPSVDLTV